MITQKIYALLPSSLIDSLRNSKFLMELINKFLKKKNGDFREVKVRIAKIYNGNKIEFDFYAPIKTATQAEKRGIESKLLNQVFELNKKYLQGRNDLAIIDIGANFGYLSSVWAKTLSSDNGKIISIEPSPHVFKSFVNTVNANIQLSRVISPVNAAVGNHDGTIKLYLNGGTSNILSGKDKENYVEVEIFKLDSFLMKRKTEAVDLIKIDVDGIELEILKGASHTIDKFKPLLVIETNGERGILEYCLQKGYSLFDSNLMPVSEFIEEIPENLFCVSSKLV